MTRARLAAISGTQMDEIVPKRRRWRVPLIAALAVIAAVVVLVFRALPSGLTVQSSDVRIATVAQGVFQDEIVVRTSIEPAISIMLDAVEAGRVEEVTVRDGAMVKAGDLLFRLSNPQRQLDLLARQSDLAQQLSNLISLRVQYEEIKNGYRRRLSDLRAGLVRAEKRHIRYIELSRQGFVSQTELESSADDLSQYRNNLEDEQRSQHEELQANRSALAQMQKAIDGLNSGIDVVTTSIDALAVRSPIDGRLTNFALHVGALVKLGDRVGRIDDPERFKLVAEIDEFYLNRVDLGDSCRRSLDSKDYDAKVTRTNPQVRDGRFTVEFVFETTLPDRLRAGQSLDCRLILGEPRTALILESGAFVNDTGGAWAFVIAPNGRHAERRAIRIGRRSNTQLEVLGGLAAGERVIVSSYGIFGKSQRLTLTTSTRVGESSDQV